MFFRFAAAVMLVTGISLLGIALEKQNLALKRSISLQHYRLEILQEQRSRLILKTHALGAISRLAEGWDREPAAGGSFRGVSGTTHGSRAVARNPTPEEPQGWELN